MQDILFHSLLNQATETHADSVADEVRIHGETSTDPHVQAAWTEYQLLQRVLPLWQSGLPTVDLSDRVWAELYPPEVAAESVVLEGPALQVFVRQSWADVRSPAQRSGVVAIALTVLVLLVGVLVISIPYSPQAKVAVRSRGPAAAGADPAVQATVASVEWAQRASSAMAEMIVSIPGKGVELVPSGGWDMNWKMTLEPLHRDAHAAWESLIDELPMTEKPHS